MLVDSRLVYIYIYIYKGHIYIYVYIYIYIYMRGSFNKEGEFFQKSKIIYFLSFFV